MLASSNNKGAAFEKGGVTWPYLAALLTLSSRLASALPPRCTQLTIRSLPARETLLRGTTTNGRAPTLVCKRSSRRSGISSPFSLLRLFLINQLKLGRFCLPLLSRLACVVWWLATWSSALSSSRPSRRTHRWRRRSWPENKGEGNTTSSTTTTVTNQIC